MGALTVMRLPEPVQNGRKSNQRLRKSPKKKLVNFRIAIVVGTDQWQEGVDNKRIVERLQLARNQRLVVVVFEKIPVVLSTLADMNRRALATEDDGSAITSVSVVFSTPVVNNAIKEVMQVRKRLHRASTPVMHQRLAVRAHHQLPYYQGTLFSATQDFYKYKTTHRARAEAHTWLLQDWTSWKSMFDNFAVPGRADFQLAKDIMSLLDVTSLSTLVQLPGSMRESCTISDLIKSLPNGNCLSDAPTSVLLQWMCKQQRQSVFISSLVDEKSRWKLPLEPVEGHVYVIGSDTDAGEDGMPTRDDVRIKEWEFAVSACHVDGKHWTLAIIDLDKREYIIYDPFNDDRWIDMTRERCVDVFL